MKSTPDGKATESDDISIVPADEEHAHAYDQITEERLARVAEQLTRDLEDLEQEAQDRRAQDVVRRRLAVPGFPLRGGSALRGLIGLLLAACIFAAAFASQSSYGGAAKQIIARWAPRLVSTSSLPPNKPDELAAQPSPSSPQMVAATPSAQTAPQESGPTAAPLSPGLAQRLQTIASDLANAEHEIEQLKTSQEQMARDNASAIEQLKASQEQMARDNAKSGELLKAIREQMVNFIAALSEHNSQPKTTAPRSRSTGTSTRKPVWTRPSPQARVQP